MKIAIGCDEIALEMKDKIKEYLLQNGYEVEDYGVYDSAPVLYPDIANKVACAVKEKRAERGVLMCGTGIGMAISANKVKGIRAAVCHDCYSSERACLSNNAQIICFGAKIISVENAIYQLKIFLSNTYQSGRSDKKIERISFYEKGSD